MGLFEGMGIAGIMKAKSKQVTSEPVAAVVARGEVEIDFQQISEILPVKGILYVGALPAEIQEITIFAAGIATHAQQAEAARALLLYLSAPANAAAIKKSGMTPM